MCSAAVAMDHGAANRADHLQQLARVLHASGKHSEALAMLDSVAAHVAAADPHLVHLRGACMEAAGDIPAVRGEKQCDVAACCTRVWWGFVRYRVWQLLPRMHAALFIGFVWWKSGGGVQSPFRACFGNKALISL